MRVALVGRAVAELRPRQMFSTAAEAPVASPVGSIFDVLVQFGAHGVVIKHRPENRVDERLPQSR